MADNVVHGDEPAKKAGEKPGIGKTGKWIEQHKAVAYGGMVVILILLFVFLRKSGGASSGQPASTAANTAAQGGIDPSTGYLYGSPADIAAMGGSGTSAGFPSGDGGGSTTTNTTTTTNNYYGTKPPAPKPKPQPKKNPVVKSGSWTDTGQKLTLAQLAKKLGVPAGSIRGANRLGQKEVAHPNQMIAGGAKFTYQKAG